MRPFGYVALTEEDSLEQHMRELQPAAMMFVQDPSTAKKYKALFPACMIAFRQIYTNGKFQENILHKTVGRTLEYAQFHAGLITKDIYLNVGCEPSANPDDLNEMRQLASETKKVAEWAVSQHQHVVLLHAAHYGWDERHWAIFSDLFDYAARNREYVVIGFDEYGAGHLFSGLVDPRLTLGSEEGHVDPTTWEDSPVPKRWHRGRSLEAVDFQRKHGLGIPRIWYTEVGLDALGDVSQWRNTLILASGYDDARGWKSIIPQMEKWWGPNGKFPTFTSPEQAYAAQFKIFRRKVYKKYWNPKTREGVEVELIFCWGVREDKTWDQFSVSKARTFQTTLSQYEEEDQVTTIPVTKPSDAGPGVEATLTGAYRLRTAPGLTSSTVIIVPIGQKVTYYPGQPSAPTKDGFTWFFVTYGVHNGFMANDGQFKPVGGQEFGPIRNGLGVPFISQRVTLPEPEKFNNCPEACLTMVVRHTAWRMASKRQLLYLTIYDAISRFNNAGNTALAGTIKTIAQSAYSIELKVMSGVPMDLITEIDSGRPIICLVNRGVLGGTDFDPFTGAHFVVVVGYGDDFYVIHDPLGTAGGKGDGRKVSRATFNNAWVTTPGNSERYVSLMVVD